MSTNEQEQDGAQQVSAVVVLAAGGGTRMKSNKSKLLHEVAGRSMLSYAVNAAEEVEPEHLVVVVGHRREQVLAHLSEIAPNVITAVQEEQNGTGHAVQCGLQGLGELRGEILVTYGDVPMLTGETLVELVKEHRAQKNHITVLTANVPDPFGYGRIIRDDFGAGSAGHGDQIARIVEQKDASPEEQAVTEINSGIYIFNAETLYEGLKHLKTDNAQGELYLTDVIGTARANQERVGAHMIDDLWQTEGVNDRVQLARMNAEMNRRIVEKWMKNGVTVQDPSSTWIHADVDLAQDVTLLAGTHLEGATSVATGAVIGPDTTLTSVEVGEDAQVVRTHGSFSVIGAGATVGPFSFLRPGTELGAKGKIGAFVETKNAQIGDGSKVPHLTYCGDARIGEGVNVGAGTIFANYDGTNKSVTHLGDNVFIGSNSVLVAPVDIADGAFVAAGSAVVEDVPAGGLAVARGRQAVKEGWVNNKRPNSKAAQSASKCPGEVHPDVAASREKMAKVKPEEYK
ncbi:bifunctional UDP-N-acetylglucosamine diphosphorylase/glucosamine-1-phosphate N-acetyltransferase GlmU [Luteococcus sp. Sow4_B9]|uniref:bifunctional UDP-N-acetylglucosamine diphosphorylase/glucosamine-1-phosphate N-acetyltransferase GlmU n=1 Tax=Luteococcus sp. Sow4_B9 TaxID=3438792 RepID=UPI003F9C80AE